KELKSKSVALLSADPKSAGKSKLAGKSVIVSDDSEEEETEANQFNVENELKNMNDSLALLTMRYKKFLRKPTFQGGASKNDGKKVFQEKESKTRVICYHCDRPGHFASECRQPPRKTDKPSAEKNEGYYKAKYLKLK
ncbi:zinc finger CCHC domain-containing protein, partial [Ancylomarina sp. 16SWW S1-10-2]|uniref:zinc finger CCHC domain-containing protein n=1 Tax=Ancylomarina sp. 16SWW S1-10-2 TaxID=2499681 RepID=UPI0012AE860E